MWRIPLPWSDDYLAFRLPFPELGLLGQGLVVGFSLLILLGVIIWLYRFESRLVERRFAALLLGLRGIVALVIFLVLALRPMRGHLFTETLPSRVVVGLDRSDSMSITDPQRPETESVQLARGLKLIEGIPDSEYRRLFEAAKLGADLSKDATLIRIKERVDPLSRKEISEQILLRDEGRWLNEIAKTHRLRLIGFSQDAAEFPLEHQALSDLLKANNRGIAFTDLKLPLDRGLESSGKEGELLGVVLITDGQHNWGGAPSNRALELANRGVPIYAIALGSSIPPTDLAVTSVKGTSTVFKDTDAFIEARLLVSNLPAGKIRVTVKWSERPEEKTPDPLVETIEHDGNTSSYIVRFQARMSRTGTESLTVTAQAENPEVKDRFPENNSREIVVNVAPDKAKVFVVDGEPRWEYHYLATALLRDPTMEIRTVVFDQPRIGGLEDAELKRQRFPEMNLPNDPETLLTQDCIILGDVTPDQITLAQRELIERFVGERGGTLVLLAGKRAIPQAFLKLENDPLGKMIPLKDAKVIDIKSGFLFALTGEGRQTPFLKMEAETGESLERWLRLPPHYWAIVGKVKEGAMPLASYMDRPRVGLIDSEFERNNGLLVRQNYGFGRVVYVGVDSTWRWRFKTGDTYHHRFWGQVIRWAASDRPLISGNEFIRFGTREPVYRADQEVEMLVRLSELVKKLPDSSLAGAKLIRLKPDGKEEYVGLTALKKNPANPRELLGQQRDLPSGDYVLEPVLPDLENKLKSSDGKPLRAPFKVLPPDSGELLNLGSNWPLLEDLAAKTGGKVVTADRADEILELLQSRTITKENRIETRLWESWWTLLLVVGLLSLEWSVRKWVGLP
jgi:hypothetical protein